MAQDSNSLTYIVRQPGKEDQKFEDSREAVNVLVTEPGQVYLFAGSELVLQKGVL